MKASGLTVAGFYKHFRSKDELLAEAISQAFSDSEKLFSRLRDVPREERWNVRRRIAGLMKERANRWMEFMPGVNGEERGRNFFVIFSAMAGAVSIARMLTEPADREKVLARMREHLLHSF